MTNSPMHFEVRAGDREQLARFDASLSDGDGPSGPGGPKRPGGRAARMGELRERPLAGHGEPDRASKLGATILRGKSAAAPGLVRDARRSPGNPFALWQGDPDAT